MAEQLVKQVNQAYNQQPIVTGPFCFCFVQKDAQIRYKRINYWDKTNTFTGT